ncbi:MAG TPA: hypothetical protein VNZ57_10690 [Longimicrobiales bacterium]|nr:hypothetical protein [Longimicrobiales bacterium]
MGGVEHRAAEPCASATWAGASTRDATDAEPGSGDARARAARPVEAGRFDPGGGGLERATSGGRWRGTLVIWIVIGCVTLSSLLAPVPATAQVSGRDELTVLGTNVAIGGATAGIVAAIRGKPIISAVAKGAGGGLLIYGGKHLASIYAFPTLGIPARIMAALGASMIRNGAAGRGAFEMVVVPVGPLTFYHAPDSAGHAPVKINLLRTIVIAALIVHDRTEFDLEETMFLGAPVFRTPDDLVSVSGSEAVIGLAFAGSMILSDRAVLNAVMGHDHFPFLVAHERVHVLQDIFAEVAVTGPIEHWLIGLLPRGDQIARYVELGFVHAAAAVPLLSTVIPHDRRPWELEADHFATRYEEINARWAF